jgi:hypothetical protein
MPPDLAVRNEMPSLDKPIRWFTEVAEVGDRWFVSLTGGVAHVGGWMRREAWIAADSAVAAFSTTVSLAKRFSSVPPAPARSSLLADGLDVLPAPDEAHPKSIRVLPENPPGVLPVLQALGQTVAKHAHVGYGSLETDTRFWALIGLLQRLRTTDERQGTES